MKRIQRNELPKSASKYLEKRQKLADQKHNDKTLKPIGHWENSRANKQMDIVLTTLHDMVGKRQRCMYCLDSQGSDIEHFRPKTEYPTYMYQWDNLLLCCTPCGRFKGTKFPILEDCPLLVNPTAENPWDSLEFDPDTGNICARFDVKLDAYSRKGEETVNALQLDRRQALSTGYLTTLRRLSAIIKNALVAVPIDAVELTKKLMSEDDHGLLGWCFSDRGRDLQPFKDLCQLHPGVWADCIKKLHS